MDFDCVVEQDGKLINEAIEGFLPSGDFLQKNVFDAMRYSITAGGKRIRPLLVLQFCRACGGDENSALPFACAIEMIHTYSLIHDDLPCMDDDVLRRGKPSCHVRFGEATALLAGDALLSQAFDTALGFDYKRSVKPENVILAAKELARASGAMGMVGGQVIDLEYEGKKASLSVLRLMHKGKTGALIEAAAKIGCLIADASPAQLEAAAFYARRIGLAFQIVDDILDFTGSASELGKQAGGDEKKGKSTYVTLLGLSDAKALAEKLTAEAESGLDVFGERKEFFILLARWLAERKN